MNAEEFEKLFEEVVDQCRQTLIVKAKEYATDNDRLHNFKIGSIVTGGTPAQTLWGFATKHIVSIRDMIRSDKYYSEEVWNEKIGDALNYLILLRALVSEDG